MYTYGQIYEQCTCFSIHYTHENAASYWITKQLHFRMCVYVCMCMYVCMYVYVCMVCMYVCMYGMYVCMVCMYVCYHLAGREIRERLDEHIAQLYFDLDGGFSHLAWLLPGWLPLPSFR